MTFRPARDADMPRITSFLRAHIQTSMFPLANLLAHGLDGTAPRAMRVWVRNGGDGVYAQTNEGIAQPQLPGATADDWSALRTLGCGRQLIGAMGDPEQVGPMLDAWKISASRARHATDEPGYALELADLVMPPGADSSRLVALESVPAALVEAWRAAYHVEVLGTPADEAPSAARADVSRWTVQDTHRVLLVDGEPVAITGFNAVADDVVQIGGVYTPLALRGQGYARQALAQHLHEVRSLGKTRALLFAANDAAARAYKAIGFRRNGRFAMVLFEPHMTEDGTGL